MWQRYQQDSGDKSGRAMNSVEKLSRYLLETKGKGGGVSVATKTARQVVTGIEAALEGRTLKKLYGTSLDTYCEAMQSEMKKFDDIADVIRNGRSAEQAQRSAMRRLADRHEAVQ